jgi:hypothetical protein
VQDKPPLVRLVPPPKKWIRHSDAPVPSQPSLMGGGIVASSGFTLLFAKQGTGKGFVCVEIASQLLQEGHIVLCLDFEKRYSEWYRRVNSLIPAKYHDRFIHYRQEEMTGTIVEMVKDIRDCVQQTDATVIIVDSYAWSVPRVTGKSVDPMREEAVLFGKALVDIGLPAVVTAHVTKSPGKKTDPYGSVYLPAAAALTWNLVANPEAKDGLEITLLNQKGNAYEKQQPIKMFFEFNQDGEPVACKWIAVNKAIIDRIVGIVQTKNCTYVEIYDQLVKRYPLDKFNRESIKSMCSIYSDPENKNRRLERLPKKGLVNESQVYAPFTGGKLGV